MSPPLPALRNYHPSYQICDVPLPGENLLILPIHLCPVAAALSVADAPAHYEHPLPFQRRGLYEWSFLNLRYREASKHLDDAAYLPCLCSFDQLFIVLASFWPGRYPDVTTNCMYGQCPRKPFSKEIPRASISPYLHHYHACALLYSILTVLKAEGLFSILHLRSDMYFHRQRHWLEK